VEFAEGVPELLLNSAPFRGGADRIVKWHFIEFSVRSEFELRDQPVQLCKKRRPLRIERRLPVAQFGDLRLLVAQFAGVILHDLLLAADLREAGDVLAVALFVAHDVLERRQSNRDFSAVVRGDLRFQIGDLLELAARGVGDRFVADVERAANRASD
jgi:hypothetical protein